MIHFITMKLYRLIFAIAFISLLVPGCKNSAPYLFKNEIDSIGIVWVPDLREGIFDADLKSSGDKFVLKGETNIPEAKEAIVTILKNKEVSFTDSLTLLPDPADIAKPWGLVNVSVCNIRFFSSYDAEMVTQAVMGTPVKLLKRSGDWLLIQTPDKYIGWVDEEAVSGKSETEHNLWKTSPRLFYIGKTGDVFTDQSGKKVISDIVAGCIVENAGTSGKDYIVKLPDGREGYIAADRAIPFEDLDAAKLLRPENLAATAESFMGIPYLWGGTPESVSRMRRPKRRLMAAPPIRTGIFNFRRWSSLTISGICLLVLTNRAESPMASALTSTALEIIVSAGTCLPRSSTV